MGKTYTAKQFLDAIPGSGGIVSTIAKRVGCDWNTARAYIDNYATVKAAYDAEREGIIDLAEGVLITNIQLAHKRQKDGGVADTSDVKWLLSRLAKERGYVERQELSGSDGGPIELTGIDTAIKKAWGNDDDNGD